VTAMSGLVFIELRFLVEEISCDATTMFFSASACLNSTSCVSIKGGAKN